MDGDVFAIFYVMATGQSGTSGVSVYASGWALSELIGLECEMRSGCVASG